MNLMLALLPYVLIVALTAVLLWLFYGMDRSVRRLRKQVAQCEASVAARGSDFANSLVELKRSMAEWGAGEPHASSQAIRVTGLNSTLRGKVLKMHRLGQPAERIAEALLVPKGEVELLVKVHRMVMRPYADALAPDAEN